MQEKKTVRPTFSAEHIFGGTLLAMCSSDFICFYDWAECRLVRRIDVAVKVSAYIPEVALLVSTGEWFTGYGFSYIFIGEIQKSSLSGPKMQKQKDTALYCNTVSYLRLTFCLLNVSESLLGGQW